METKFPFRQPIIEAMCEIASAFNAIRYKDNFPKSWYVVTIALESKREDRQDIGLNASHRNRSSDDDFFQIDFGAPNVAGLGGGRVARRLSTTPVTFALTELGKENKKLEKHCVGAHAANTNLAVGSEAISLGLEDWFADVMLSAPVGFPDGVTTTLYLEYAGGGSVFPSWRFVRGFIDPSLAAGYLRYDQLKVELKSQPDKADQSAGEVRVTRGRSTTTVPAISTESYRNMQQQRIIIGN